MSGATADGDGDVRHVALQCEGDLLTVYFTRIGGAPERILRSQVNLSRSSWFWRAGPAVEVLAPAEDWEGAQLPVAPSRSGAAKGPEHALRDPAIFVDEGRTYLLYSVAGESGIAIAEII
jgi:hypothetical protein